VECIPQPRYTLGLKHKFMNRDPDLPVKFANGVLEELAILRGELVSQRSLLIELLSRTTREPRRRIKDRLYDKRLVGPVHIARELKQRVGLKQDLP
jgi:hypothetical protein